MYERLKYLYNAGKLNAALLDIAVSKKWITEEQKTEITAA